MSAITPPPFVSLLSLSLILLLCSLVVIVNSAVLEENAKQKPHPEQPLTTAQRAQLRAKAEHHVAKINSQKHRKWKAKLHPRFAEMSQKQMRRWLGLGRDAADELKRKAGQRRRQDVVMMAKREAGMGDARGANGMMKPGPVPPPPEPTEHFDARQQWPQCADVISQIQDQSGCGSCWAIAPASVMQDRLCVASRGAIKLNVSSEDILSCEPRSLGCDGGYPQYAFEFWQNRGICSGGQYGSKAGCKPYPFPPHADQEYDTPRCKHRCENRYYKSNYAKDKHYGLKPMSLVDSSEEEIMNAIQAGGSVEADMVVYYDFFHYHSGVYEHDPESDLAGGHAVRIIGWGHDNATQSDYWLVANSWNTDWGDQGFFKIARGQDECEIETWGINWAEPDMQKERAAGQ